LHTDGHRRLGEAILLHGGFDLIGEDLLDGLFLTLFQNALFGQKTIKGRTYLTLLLFVISEHLPSYVGARVLGPGPASSAFS
jgi:hypothetical protein